MEYMKTYTGLKFYPQKPKELEVSVLDIAHHLSMINRYCGALEVPYSVGQHSLIVEQLFHQRYPEATADERLGALLHDSEEAYLSDLVSPVKHSLADYMELAAKVTRRIFKVLKVSLPLHPFIKQIDTELRVDEVWYLSAWDHADMRLPNFNTPIIPSTPGQTKFLFLQRFVTLKTAEQVHFGSGAESTE